MKTALVTGGAGFVGRHMIPALIARDYAVTTVDLRPMPTQDSKHIHYIEDIRRWIHRRGYLGDPYDLVIHLAAVVGGRTMIDGDPLAVATDLAIDSDVINWCVKSEQPRLVYYSSSAAYPTWLQSGRQPYRLEESDINLWGNQFGVPDMTYGWVKLTGEYTLQFAAKEGLKTHIFRPFSGYGEDQDLCYPFPALIERAVSGDDPFTIWGDGEQTRDWIHIDDVIGGTLAIVESDPHGVLGPVNLCTGEATAFSNLADLMCHTAGYEHAPELHFDADRPTGVRYRVGDPTKMLRFYRPQVSLIEGIQRSLKWRRA